MFIYGKAWEVRCIKSVGAKENALFNNVYLYASPQKGENMVLRNVVNSALCMILLISASLVQAAELPNFTVLAEKAGSAVVNISTETEVSKNNNLNDFFGGMPPGFDEFFKQFGGPFGNFRNQSPQQRKERSLGTGFIVSPDGYIVTNHHVVGDADIIRVNLQGAIGKSEAIPAKLIGSDEETDLALIKVDVDEKLPFLAFGDSDAAKVGEWVLAIGNPFGLEHTVTAGILSAKGRNINAGPFDNFLQTDASINPGNSGGPLINMRGEVIGINTAIIASGQGIGFAIPSSMAKTITDQLKTGQKVRRGWLGVTIQNLDENAAKALGLEKTDGSLVGSVMPGEPADKGGVKAGDVIIKVNDKAVKDSSELLRAIAELKPGSDARLTVWRNGEKVELTVNLGERNVDSLTGQSGDAEKKHEEAISLGIAVRPLTEEEAKSLDLKAGEGLLIVEVDDDTPAAEAELRTGDVILSANMTPVSDVATLAKMLQEVKERGAIMLQIKRRGEIFFRAVSIEK